MHIVLEGVDRKAPIEIIYFRREDAISGHVLAFSRRYPIDA
jgi:hypothetical protein